VRIFSGVRAQSLVFSVLFCKSLFVPLPVFFWPLHFLVCVFFLVRITTSYYHFSIFKHLSTDTHEVDNETIKRLLSVNNYY
jgi:hypothetical protein